MSNRNLAILFGILLAIYLLSQFLGSNKETSIDRSVISIDTSQVTSIIIHPKSGNEEPFSLEKKGTDWQVTRAEFQPTTNQSIAESMLRTLADIKIERLVSRSRDRWEDYEVSDEKGTRIEVYNQGKKIEDIVIGRFNFNQATRAATSYIRQHAEDDIYSVDGFLSMSLGQGFDSYRDKTILDFDKNELNHILLESSGRQIPFSKIDEQWMSEGAHVDSSSMVQYINSLNRLSGATFYDNADYSSLPIGHKLTVTTVTDQYTVDVRVRDNEFVINSSDNKSTYFLSDSSGVYQKLIEDLVATRR